MSIAAIIEQLYLLSVGLSVLFGICGFMLYRNSWRWRQLATVYTAATNEKPKKQRWTNMILHGAGAWNTYSGTTLVGINEQGLTLKVLPPFSFFHRPLFFPFEEVRLVPTRWLFQDAYQIALDHDKGLCIVINASTVDWINKRRAELAGYPILT